MSNGKIILLSTNEFKKPKERTCRFCNRSGISHIPIFDKSNGILKKLNTIFPMKIKLNDERPRHICPSCSMSLKVSYTFHSTVLRTEKNYNQTLKKSIKKEQEDDDIQELAIVNAGSSTAEEEQAVSEKTGTEAQETENDEATMEVDEEVPKEDSQCPSEKNTVVADVEPERVVENVTNQGREVVLKETGSTGAESGEEVTGGDKDSGVFEEDSQQATQTLTVIADVEPIGEPAAATIEGEEMVEGTTSPSASPCETVPSSIDTGHIGAETSRKKPMIVNIQDFGKNAVKLVGGEKNSDCIVNDGQCHKCGREMTTRPPRKKSRGSRTRSTTLCGSCSEDANVLQSNNSSTSSERETKLPKRDAGSIKRKSELHEKNAEPAEKISRLSKRQGELSKKNTKLVKENICEQNVKSFEKTGVLAERDAKRSGRKRAWKRRQNLPCPTCNKLFSYKNTLKRHEILHQPSSTWPFFCSKCRRRYPYAHAFLSHLKMHKKENKK